MSTDVFGNWEDLGSIEPKYGEWDSFQYSETSVPIFTFRATFNASNWGTIYGYCTLRVLYSNLGVIVSSKNYRLYPSEIPIVFNIPRVLDANFLLQIKRRKYSSYRIKGVDSTLSVKMEVKTIAVPVSNDQIIQQLNEIEQKLNSLL